MEQTPTSTARMMRSLSFGGDEAAEVGAGESDPTVRSPFDFDVMQDGQSGFEIDHFAESGEGGLELRNGQGEGSHGRLGFGVEHEKALAPMKDTGA